MMQESELGNQKFDIQAHSSPQATSCQLLDVSQDSKKMPKDDREKIRGSAATGRVFTEDR